MVLILLKVNAESIDIEELLQLGEENKNINSS